MSLAEGRIRESGGRGSSCSPLRLVVLVPAVDIIEERDDAGVAPGVRVRARLHLNGQRSHG
jgi:hypothetical protein